ncbi:MAG: 3-oxoacyl-ACP synthase, partial [Eubacteriales bacterium]
MNFKITGTGSYAPTNTVSNDDLAKFLDTSDEWITQRVGVRTRRVSTGETAADFAVKAAQNALEMSGIDAKDLDLIVAASLSSDFACPTVA